MTANRGSSIVFRPAEITDTELLWRWRLEAEEEGRRGGWYLGESTSFDVHKVWLIRNIGRIRVWEENLHPHGQVRVESNGELSFFVPLLYRRDGVEDRMLRATHELAAEYGGRLKVTVDEANEWARLALLRAGFEVFPVKFYAYRI